MAAAARGHKALGTLPQLVKSLRSEPVSNGPRLRQLPSLRRTFSLYDQINLIDSVPEDQLRFQSYDDTGFKINNVKYEGSLLIVENKIMTWVPKTFAEISAESLSIFKVVHPIPGKFLLAKVVLSFSFRQFFYVVLMSSSDVFVLFPFIYKMANDLGAGLLTIAA
ncbi:hypothetical protein PR202_ga07911 [Eleusine coracana subsp. coracana]|uniref:Uncharacterized protein n=1 Tax=Eleusine coracana subsp. coracana TaxID=191504 RepID=A0AAV5C1D1_ELECO|nr:hypothetical protein PR202_ga07911 [Eleusine coracana subsp. coracana]